MATVYAATDLRLERVVALKVMHPSFAEDPEFVGRFVREARSAARLSDPHVVAVFDQGETLDGVAYLVMEYVDGRTLRDVLHEHGPCTSLQALTIIESVAEALAAAHRGGIVHRDIKPENVLIDDRGRIKVADFGLARAVTSNTSHVATQGLLIGTVAYLSPEQVETGMATARSDVYGAGVLLYEILTGEVPFSGETPLAVAYKHVNSDVPPPSEVVGTIPPQVDALVLRATARSEAARFADGAALLEAVRRTRSSLPAPTGAEESDTIIVPRAAAAAGAAVAGAAVAGAALAGAAGTTANAATGAGAPAVAGAGVAALGVPASAAQHTAVLPVPAPQTASVAVAPAPSVPGVAPQGVAHQGVAGLLHASAGGDDSGDGGLPPKKKRRGRKWLWLFGILIVLGLVGGGAYAIWKQSQQVQVPGLINLTPSQASSLLAREGLHLTIAGTKFSETIKPGHIVSSNPLSGDTAIKGDPVYVMVSKGPERHPVPDVSGMTPAAATAALKANRLTVGVQTKAYNDSITKGLVVRTNPPKGQSLRRNTAVDLVISKGPAPVPVPTVVGKTEAVAKSRLSNSGLYVSKITRQYSNTVPAGIVLTANPAAGTVVDHGSGVSLVVSKGPPPVTVPGVRDNTVSVAVSRLQAVGLHVKIKYLFGGSVLGRVYSQSPAAGTVVPRGTTVTLSVI
jgi:serine/threonine-protein kinase